MLIFQRRQADVHTKLVELIGDSRQDCGVASKRDIVFRQRRGARTTPFCCPYVWILIVSLRIAYPVHLSNLQRLQPRTRAVVFETQNIDGYAVQTRKLNCFLCDVPVWCLKVDFSGAASSLDL